MDYSKPQLANLLAAEYVLGTLVGPARRRFEALLPAHPALRSAVAEWQQRLAPLATVASPPTATATPATPLLQPSPAVWLAIQERLFGLTPPAMSNPDGAIPWWRRLGLWQGLSGAALAGVLGLSVMLQRAPPGQAPIVVVLNATAPANAGASPTSASAAAHFVVSLSADGRALVLKPVNAPAIETTKAMELWAVPAQGAPRSLGLLSANQTATVLRTGLLEGTAAFAVSVEPAGGSPTGAPTGPIVSLGKLAI